MDVDISDDYKLLKAILNVLSENHITASIREIIRITKTHDVTERHVQKVVLGQCEEFECEDSLKKIKELGMSCDRAESRLWMKQYIIIR